MPQNVFVSWPNSRSGFNSPKSDSGSVACRIEEDVPGLEVVVDDVIMLQRENEPSDTELRPLFGFFLKMLEGLAAQLKSVTREAGLCVGLEFKKIETERRTANRTKVGGSCVCQWYARLLP